jgi:hypothetical protein
MNNPRTFWIVVLKTPQGGTPLCAKIEGEEGYAPVVFDDLVKAKRFSAGGGPLGPSGKPEGPTTLRMILDFERETGAASISLNPHTTPMISDIVSFEGMKILYGGGISIKHRKFFKEVVRFLRGLLQYRTEAAEAAMLAWFSGNEERVRRDRELAEEGLVYLTKPDGATLYKHISSLSPLDVPDLMREIETNAALGSEYGTTDKGFYMAESPTTGRVLLTPEGNPEGPSGPSEDRRLMERWIELKESWPRP